MNCKFVTIELYYLTGVDPDLHFTAVIYATTPAAKASDPIYRLLKNILKSQWVKKVTYAK